MSFFGFFLVFFPGVFFLVFFSGFFFWFFSWFFFVFFFGGGFSGVFFFGEGGFSQIFVVFSLEALSEETGGEIDDLGVVVLVDGPEGDADAAGLEAQDHVVQGLDLPGVVDG